MGNISLNRSRVALRRSLGAVVGLVLIAGAGVAVSGCAISQAAPRHQVVIGFSQRQIAGSDWYATLVKGARWEAKRLGVKLEVTDAAADSIQQYQDIQTLLARDVNGMIVNANDPDAMQAAVRSMRSDHVPFVLVNSTIAPSVQKYADCYIAEDQVTTGAKVGRLIAHKAIQRYGTHASVKLLAVGGFPGDTLTELRWKGFEKGYRAVMKRYPRFHTTNLPMQYGNWLPNIALPLVENIASANPSLRIVYSESDVMQAGIQRGLLAGGLWGKNILEGSYDGGMNTVGYMKNHPHGPVQADGANVPFNQGAQAVRLTLAALRGHDHTACPKGAELISTPLVTPANANRYFNPKLTHVQIPSSKVRLTASGSA